MSLKSRTLSHFLLLPVVVACITAYCAGCASAPAGPDENQTKIDQVRAESEAREKQLQEMSKRVEQLESKLAMMNEKFDTQKLALENAMGIRAAQPMPVLEHPAENRGSEITPLTSTSASGYREDTATQEFRDSLILFDAKKYPDALLSFSKFVGKHGNHPLAGSAQFYVGECYFHQNELQLALSEYQKVLVSHPLSNRVSDSLWRMMQAEETLKKTEAANEHRRALLQLFPHSPAAGELKKIAAASAPSIQPDPAPTPIPTAPVPAEDAPKETHVE